MPFAFAYNLLFNILLFSSCWISFLFLRLVALFSFYLISEDDKSKDYFKELIFV